MTYFNNIKTTRVAAGIYRITREGRTFEAQKTEDGQWQMLQLVENNVGLPSEWEYIEHYLDLRSCKILVNDYFNEIN